MDAEYAPAEQRQDAGWELLPAQKKPGVHAVHAQLPPAATYVPGEQLQVTAWAAPPAQLSPAEHIVHAHVAVELADVLVDAVPGAQAQGAGGEPPPEQKYPRVHGPQPQADGAGAPSVVA